MGWGISFVCLLVFFKFLHAFPQLIHGLAGGSLQWFLQGVAQRGHPARVTSLCSAAGDGIHHKIGAQDEQDK